LFSFLSSVQRKQGKCIMETAKVSAKGQINIPIAIRKLLNINEGDKVLFIVDGESV